MSGVGVCTFICECRCTRRPEEVVVSHTPGVKLQVGTVNLSTQHEQNALNHSSTCSTPSNSVFLNNCLSVYHSAFLPFICQRSLVLCLFGSFIAKSCLFHPQFYSQFVDSHLTPMSMLELPSQTDRQEMSQGGSESFHIENFFQIFLNYLIPSS